MDGRSLSRFHYHVREALRVRSAWLICPVRDIDAHEGVGHTIATHIALTPAALLERLVAENRRAVSAFWDSSMAGASINYAFANGFDAIAEWFFTSAVKRYRL